MSVELFCFRWSASPRLNLWDNFLIMNLSAVVCLSLSSMVVNCVPFDTSLSLSKFQSSFLSYIFFLLFPKRLPCPGIPLYNF